MLTGRRPWRHPSHQGSDAPGPSGVVREAEGDVGRIHLAEAGSGPLVLLLHGFPESWYSWRHQLEVLSEAGFRVVAPDLRGHDARSVDDVIGLADALGVEQFIAVGYSLGSAVASQLARRHADRVQGVVLCAAAGVAVPSPESRDAVEIPTAVVVTRHDGIISARRQLQLARSLPGASVHAVEGNHLAFSQYEVFVPVLLDACQSVARPIPREAW